LAPDFRLLDQHGKTHAVSDYAGRWLVLYFYPKDDTPGCTREACAFRDSHTRLLATGAAVLGVSLDSPESHGKFAEKYRLPFALLADSDGAVALKYGALMDWLVFRMARRMTFLINPAGRLHRIYLKPDPGRHAEEILAEMEKTAQ
jgi:peroxiredoxin Q/BCP